MWRTAYPLIPLGKGDRGDSSGRGGVRNGGLWWPEWTSEGDGLLLAVAGDFAVVSLEELAGLLELRGSFRW